MLEVSFCGVKCMCVGGGERGERGAVLPQGRCSFHLVGAAIEKKASTVYVRFVSRVSNHLFQAAECDLSV